MTQQTYGDDEANTVNEIAKEIGIKSSVKVSPELFQLINPNDFLKNLGIQFTDRLNVILSILKGSLLPKGDGHDEKFPKEGFSFPISLTTGPYIREGMLSINAELTKDNGEKEILLSVIKDPE